MIDLRLDSTSWDIQIVGGDLRLVAGDDTTVQHIRQRLQTFQSEWFLDLNLGVPWLQEILGKPSDIAIVEAILKEAIASTPGVDELLSFSIEEGTGERDIRVEFSVRLDTGNTVTDSAGLSV